jgi:hypothetical protein
MIKCAECGYENMDGLDYCDGCGARISASAAGSGGGEPTPATEQAAPETQPDPGAEVSRSEATTGEVKPPAEPASQAAAATATAAAAPVSEAVPHFKAKFEIVRGGRKGHEFPLEAGNNFIGRWDPETGSFPEVDLEQDDPEAKISRKHALVRIEDGKITVEDIGSLNGTYVNRQPRLQPGTPVEIKSGDEIIIGKTFLKLVVEPIS